MAQSAIATAADYADAMGTARRALKWVFFLLLLTLLVQLGIFLAVRFEVVRVSPAEVVVLPAGPAAGATTRTTTGPAATAPVLEAAEPPGEISVRAPAAGEVTINQGLRFLVGLTNFLGLVFVLLLGAILLLIVMIMLVGRLIGVARVTSAFIWCVVLALFIFPWQAFLNWQQLDPAWQLVGVLYTWGELTHPRVLQDFTMSAETVLMWTRFVVYSLVAIIVLLMIQTKAIRGLKLALGEMEIEREEPPPVI